MRVRAERAPAVGDDLGIVRKLREALLELLDRDRARAVDVAGGVLLAGAHVHEHDVAPREPGAELRAADALDVLAEVVAGGALDLGQPCAGSVAQRQPQTEHFIARDGVADTRALALARHHAGGVQRLEVLRAVGARLAARPGQLLDRTWRLREQVEQLQPARAPEGFAHQGDRFEEHVLVAP